MASTLPPDGPPPEGPPPRGFRQFLYYLRYLRQVKGTLILVLLGTGAMALLRLPMLFLPKVLTEHFENKPYIFGYLAFVLATFVLGAVVGLANSFLTAKLG